MSEKKSRKVYVILSEGVWRRPIDTPAGKAGWVGEITFYKDPRYPFILRHDNIQEVFNTELDAIQFVKSALYKLTHGGRIKVRRYNHEYNYFTKAN